MLRVKTLRNIPRLNPCRSVRTGNTPSRGLATVNPPNPGTGSSKDPPRSTPWGQYALNAAIILGAVGLIEFGALPLWVRIDSCVQESILMSHFTHVAQIRARLGGSSERKPISTPAICLPFGIEGSNRSFARSFPGQELHRHRPR